MNMVAQRDDSPTVAVVVMACHRCGGTGTVDVDGPLDCDQPCDFGRVTYHLATVDCEVYGYSREHRELLYLGDGARVLERLEEHGVEAALTRWKAKPATSARDRWLLDVLEVSR